MRSIYSEGPTTFLLNSPLTNSNFRVSLVSKRTARFVCIKSMVQNWGRATAAYYPKLRIGELVLCGFQPETGNHIAYYEPTDRK